MDSDPKPVVHGRARMGFDSCSSPSSSGLSLARMLFAATAFAFASLCYYTVAVASTTRPTPSLPRPPRRREAHNIMALVHTAKLPARAVSQDDAAVVFDDEPMDPPQLLDVQPSREQLPMADAFYSSATGDADMSTTIIFNVFKGEPRALEQQLRMAAQQQKLTSAPDVWVMCFASPRQREYEAVVTMLRDDAKLLPQLVFTASNFNHKFHGRFLLAYMATTKYVLIVDDDKMIDATTVFDYIQYMKKTPGIWGNNGHLRSESFGGYKSWPSVGYDPRVDDMAEQDYLSGMWFLQQSWLEYFVKERVPTWATAEDMHLSHVMRKYLNLNTYGGRVALSAAKLPSKKHAATVGKALDLREFVFDHQLGRGNKVANVVAPIRTLVFAETVEDIRDMVAKIQSCRAETDMDGDDPRGLRLRGAGESEELDSSRDSGRGPVVVALTDDDEEEQAPWCNAGKTAVVFRGAAEQDTVGLIAAAEWLCSLTACEFVALKPKIRHPIRYFNMREGYGHAGTDIPWQTAVSDVITSLVGVLNNVQPQRFLFPAADRVRWREPEWPASRKRSRLQIYHNAVRLALQIHVNTVTNQKWDLRNLSADAETAFPSDLRVFTWRKTVAIDPTGEEGEREEDGAEVGESLYQEFSFFE